MSSDLSPPPLPASTPPVSQARSIRKWKFLFDRTYQTDASPFSGWISSHDGAPIPVAEMEQWLDATVDRILALHPTAVLEIGCGTGLIARRVAPLVERYAGVDISAAAIEQLNAAIGEHSETTFVCAAAHEVAAHFEPGFDLVIINSVIQYFGDTAYLEAVLTDAIALLRPGGSLFLGDLRNADLSDIFATSVAQAQLGPEATPDAIRERADSLSAAEDELQLSPRYVRGLAEGFPRISGVATLLKPGSADNELSRFRYDAVIALDGAPPEPAAETLRWTMLDDPWAALEKRLAQGPGNTLLVTGIGNARLDAPRGEQPGAFERLGDRLGFAVSLLWNEDDPGAFDVLFHPGAV